MFLGTVHKSTVVAMLNASPTGLSLDRLRRVQARSSQEPEEAFIETRKTIGLFSDVAVLIKSGQVYSWAVGRVQRMRKKGTSGIIDYRNPVNIEDRQHQDVNIMLNMYENANSIFQKFVYTNTKLEFKLYNILMGVELVLDDLVLDDKLCYNLTEEDHTELDTCVALKNQKPTRTQTTNTGTHDSAVDDGSYVRLVTPDTNTNNDNLRRSGRQRKERVHLQ